MPARSEKQRRLMAMDFQRVQEGKAPKATKGMTQAQRHDYMGKPKGGSKKGK